MPVGNSLTWLILSILLIFVSCDCDPNDCGSGCCTMSGSCAASNQASDGCYYKSCERYCPSKCCYGGVCNSDDSNCTSTSSRLKVIIIIVAAACFISLVCIVYMKKHQQRRRFFARQRASEANRNRNRGGPRSQNNIANPPAENHEVYIFQGNNAPTSPQNLLNFNPRNLGIESGQPFREGGMRSAYELNLGHNIEYGEVSFDQQLIKKEAQREIQEGNQGGMNMNLGAGAESPAAALSLGDFMLKAEYQFEDSKGNGSGNLSGLEN